MKITKECHPRQRHGQLRSSKRNYDGDYPLKANKIKTTKIYTQERYECQRMTSSLDKLQEEEFFL